MHHVFQGNKITCKVSLGHSVLQRRRKPPEIVFSCCANSEILKEHLKCYDRNGIFSTGIIVKSIVPNWSLQLTADTLSWKMPQFLS